MTIVEDHQYIRKYVDRGSRVRKTHVTDNNLQLGPHFP